ncbi:hypothetical protein [Haloarcula salina]|uniref:Uncharacterized protein n=1 Tax=Haloarcula salina TaxID=1429914 RepID=A0AA41G3J2_9EURY|nr:hypothetical protein [Haloarcula salina]MBV0903621.1 hypothetical protein [Haloarcula salina]
MSCPCSLDAGAPPGDASADAEDTRSRERGGRLPTHNWRHTVVYGLVFWAVVIGAWIAVPAGHPFQLGVALSGLFAAPLLPVALCCDYRQARQFGTCEPGVRAYLANLATDLATALAGRRALGDERREFTRC